MAPSKKHHFVPQFILKNFQDGSGRLFVFDKETTKVIPSNAGNAGHENNFNTIQHDGQVINFEPAFDKIDGNAAPIIEGLVKAKGKWEITRQQKNDLSIFIAAQLLRTKMPRSQVKHLYKDINDWTDKLNAKSKHHIPQLPNLTDDDTKISALESLANLDDYKSKVIEKDILIFKTDDRYPFYSSDNPAVMLSARPDRLPGLDVSGTDIYYPISPTLILCFMDKNLKPKIIKTVYTAQISKVPIPLEIQQCFKALIFNEIVKINNEYVDFYNSLQVNSSSRFVYSNLDDFKLVKEMIVENPNIKSVESLYKIGSNFFPQIPPGQIAVIAVSDEEYFKVEIINQSDSAFEIKFKVMDVMKFTRLCSIKGPIQSIGIFIDQSQTRYTADQIISNIDVDTQTITFTNQDPGVEKMLKHIEQLRQKGKKE